MGSRKTLTWRLRQYTFPELPEHYMQPKKKAPPITASEMAKRRWAGVSAEDRSKILRRAVMKRWKKKVKKKP